jgi:hypothetical protein
VLDRLKDHAVAFGHFKQLSQIALRGVRLDIEMQADLLESDGHTVRDAEGATKIDIAFGRKWSPI